MGLSYIYLGTFDPQMYSDCRRALYVRPHRTRFHLKKRLD